MAVEPLHRITADPAAQHIEALRAVSKAIDTLADAMEAEGAAQHRPGGRPDLPAAFGAADAASYCGIGATLLRAQGPAPRFVGGRAVWLRRDLDEWLAQIPTQPTHRRGLTRSRKGGCI